MYIPRLRSGPEAREGGGGVAEKAGLGRQSELADKGCIGPVAESSQEPGKTAWQKLRQGCPWVNRQIEA